MLTLGYFDEKEMVMKNINEIKNFIAINNISLGDQIGLIDGVGRAQAKFKKNKALHILEDAENFYFKSKCSQVYRLIQIKRSQMEALLLIQPKDKITLERLGKEALGLAKKHHFKRFEAKIKSIMRSFL